MIPFEPAVMVLAYLREGYSICYIDSDEERRRHVDLIIRIYSAKKSFESFTENGELNGRGRIHTNLLIAVNEETFDPIVRSEMIAQPGVCNGIGPAIIRISA